MTVLSEPTGGSVASSLRSTWAGWRLPAYLVTKAIASGMFMIMAAVWLLGVSTFDRRTALVGNGIALVFLAITTVLLVADLDRPERFLRILTRPQWKSWLTRGAFILVGFSVVCTAWFAVELGAQLGWLPEGVAEAVRVPLMMLGFPLALMSAIYTAFLFRQCEGGDLWQSRLLPWHMGVQAVMAGGAVWTLLLFGYYTRWVGFVSVSFLPELPFEVASFLVAGVVDLLIRWAEVSHHLPTANGTQAAWIVRFGGERGKWRASMLMGGQPILSLVALFGLWNYWQDKSVGFRTKDAVPFQLTLIFHSLKAVPVVALVGLFLYESAIIKAGQDVPNA
ncbi:MAG: polysulfide reductase NrfD [Ardenticatenia bacterium]|nr:polysulfide reductase NrfD [Ardenticatenia bacterium]